jgi:hypothetical protein
MKTTVCTAAHRISQWHQCNAVSVQGCMQPAAHSGHCPGKALCSEGAGREQCPVGAEQRSIQGLILLLEELPAGSTAP